MIETHWPTALLLAALLTLTSCNNNSRKANRPRFVPYPNDHDYALETTTGTLCKTWQWQHTPKQPIDAIPVCFEMH